VEINQGENRYLVFDFKCHKSLKDANFFNHYNIFLQWKTQSKKLKCKVHQININDETNRTKSCTMKSLPRKMKTWSEINLKTSTISSMENKP